jgi:hypothetical protein
MGHVVQPSQLLTDMAMMGIEIEQRILSGKPLS